MKEQEQMMIQILQQEKMQLQEQIEAIVKHREDMEAIVLGIDELNEESEILANIGKGIYIPAKVKSKQLVMDIGNKVFVEKSIPEIKKVIEEELKKLVLIRQEMNEKIISIDEEIENLVKS
jgi:prefoldin alpha subunit